MPKRADFKITISIASLALLCGCGGKSDAPLLGTLEWDRASVAAEVSEPIISIAVAEGDTVAQGAALLELDPRSTDADLARATALAQQSQAQLTELRHGARAETVDAARADLARSAAEADNAQRELERNRKLLAMGAISDSVFRRVETEARSAGDAQRSADAKLRELLHGTRPEQIDQAEAALAAAQAEAQLLKLRRERLSVRAPRAGRIDALPFKLGDQPPAGATVASVLAGDAPYARVYVPASRRAQLAVGAHCEVTVQGVDQQFAATLRSLRSDPAFTPYYALTGDDASRLAYRAELRLDAGASAKLPAGLPVTAHCGGDGH